MQYLYCVDKGKGNARLASFAIKVKKPLIRDPDDTEWSVKQYRVIKGF